MPSEFTDKDGLAILKGNRRFCVSRPWHSGCVVFAKGNQLWTAEHINARDLSGVCYNEIGDTDVLGSPHLLNGLRKLPDTDLLEVFSGDGRRVKMFAGLPDGRK